LKPSFLLIYLEFIREGIGTGINKLKGCQGFVGPVPPPFFISITVFIKRTTQM